MTAALDLRSHFSVGESLLTPEQCAEFAAAAGYKAAALCDTMTISGMPDFTRACDGVGIKPIIGVRLRIVPDLEREKRQPQVFPKLYILTEDGLGIVMRLLTKANDAEHFYYRPRLTWDDLLDALDASAAGHVAYSTGTLYSALRDARCVETARKISASLRASHALAELCPIDAPVWDRQADVAIALAEELGIPTLVTSPALYAEAGLDESLAVMNAIAMNRKILGREFRAHVRDYVVKDVKSLVQAANHQRARLFRCGVKSVSADVYRDGIKAAVALADAVAFKWSKREVTLPRMAPDENAELRRLAVDGLRARLGASVFGHKPARADLQRYKERLLYELEVLTKMGFAGYFLLTREIVVWAKDQGILVGPGRGSVGGSLVAYALGITDVDPIRFDLLFERFINPERLDLPDADLDFMSTRRHEVIRHIEDTYGRDRVAGISNYVSLAAGQAIQDVVRILDLPKEEFGVSKHVPQEHGSPVSLTRAYDESQAVSAFAARHPDAWRHALALEGRNRTLARHAAGVVVAGEPLVNRAVIESRSGEPTVNWDKRVVEDMGLVKMDILGLSTLDLLRVALDHILERTGRRVDLTAIPLDDEAVLDAFGQGDTVGVFQFESVGMRKLLRNLARGGRLTFDDIAAATALYRPGPMDSGLLDDFVGIKQGFMEPYYDHEAMKPALAETYSVIVYQEQVMRVARDLCGFTLAESDHLRKAIGKKDPVKMASMGDRFVQGAIVAGMEEARARALWDKIVKFAGYAFNKSHSVEYSLISYQSMWLKVHYPVEFYAGAMTVLSEDKMQGLLLDARARGIEVVPPDVNISTNRYEILTETRLAAPFPVVKGISEATGEIIVAERAKNGVYKDRADFRDRLPARRVNRAVMDRLDAIGGFARLEPGQRDALDESRRADQLLHCPAIITGGALVTRALPRDKATVAALRAALEELAIADAPVIQNAVICSPRFGKRAKFMAVTDGPSWSEEQGKQFTKGQSFLYVLEALEAVGLDVEDGYWTGLCKAVKPKGAKLYSAEQLAVFTPTFLKELEILKPQVVLLLGSNVTRLVLPKLKGSPMDHAGKVFYEPGSEGLGNDRNVVIGINPGMIAFESSRQEVLEDAFRKVAEMVI